MYKGLGGWLLRLAAELAGPRGTPRELAGRRCRTPEDSRRTLAGTGAGLCGTSKDAPSCRGSSCWPPVLHYSCTRPVHVKALASRYDAAATCSNSTTGGCTDNT